ncbi:proton-conducting transporter transmembrane domain-containing protein [Sorangium sp. So ce204]|uniref:proton-conducting transporter transmembrane domain-containing protein n=1 Tax=Sorangium sp. So ce204 TaxID=3133288 RepID=UPI003F6101E4
MPFVRQGDGTLLGSLDRRRARAPVARREDGDRQRGKRRGCDERPPPPAVARPLRARAAGRRRALRSLGELAQRALDALSPAAAFAALGAYLLLLRTPSERVVSRVVLSTLALSLAASLAIWLSAVTAPYAVVPVALGRWFELGDHAFEVVLLVERLSATMMLLVSLIALLVGRFSVAYLHRKPGFARFFLLLALFSTGMLGLVSAGSVDLLFAGWELAGATSVLLVASFHEREAPPRAAVRVYITYRLCDIGLLGGAVLMHDVARSSQWGEVFGGSPWPGGAASLGPGAATALALCLFLAAMGKSAQLPLGSWLPRAMEGPTPSSALFYGAISVHAGVYQLLRAPSALRDAQDIRAAHAGEPLPHLGLAGRLLPAALVRRAYWLSLDRGLQERLVAAPLMRLGRLLDRSERRWGAALSGWPERTPAAPGDEGARGETEIAAAFQPRARDTKRART